ncbi:MAG: hypothetical protein KDB14_18515, partial [Planctomycetales bacterium]|nr:hypothetical protein [Planctomycetales bacterium]
NDTLSDNTFDPVADQTVTVTTVDNDTAGFTIVESGGATSVNESGTNDTFTVVLNAAPLTDVVIDVSSGDTGEATVAPVQLTFTSTNWNTPQTVTVTGVDDPSVDGDQTTTVTVSINDALSDNAFDPVADQTVTVTTIDNDTAGFTIVESGGSTSVNESGTTDTFTVVLNAAPLTDVVIDVSSGDAGEATVSPLQLTFTSTNWNTPQTVTVTGVDDVSVDGDQGTTVTVSINDTLSDNAFDPVADQTVSVTTVDNDVAGLVIVESGGSTSVNESGTTDIFTVALAAQPATPVVVDIISGNTSEATVAPVQLTFTPSTWSTPQTVTVTGVDDAIIDGNQVVNVSVQINDGLSDDLFDGIVANVTAVNVDDDGTFACQPVHFTSQPGAFFGVEFGNVASIPLVPAGTSSWSFDFDRYAATQSPTESGYTTVSPTAIYSSLNGYGWQASVSSFDRGNGVASVDDDLLRDGHFGSAAKVFTADVANGWYAVSVTIGDDAASRNFIQVLDADHGQPLVSVNSAAGEFVVATMFVQVDDGTLDLEFSNLGGDPFWVVNALVIEPAAISASSQVIGMADGQTVDTYVGSATPGELVTVSTQSGTITSPDASSDYAGVQVVADGSGSFSYTVRRNTASGHNAVVTQAGGVVTCQVVETTPSDHWKLDLGAASVQPTYLPLLSNTLYSPGVSGVGWLTPQQSFDRGPQAGYAGSLRRDGHYGSVPSTLRAEVAPGDYIVSVTLGDAGLAADQVSVNVNGSPLAAGVTTLAGEFYQGLVPITVGPAGLIDIEIDDLAGDPYWRLNGLEIVPAAQVADLQFSTSGGSQIADGVTIDTITGTTSLPDGTLLSVTTDLGQIVSDASPSYQGHQVIVTGGTFSFDVQRPFNSGTPLFSVWAVDGSGVGSSAGAISYVDAPEIRFDFNGSSNDTQPGMIGVATTQIFTPSAGYGWQATARGYQRGTFGYSTPDVSLVRDGAWGPRGSASTFIVAVTPGGSYDVTAYVGDRNYARDLIQVATEDGQTAVAPSTAANQFVSVTLMGVVDNGDGQLEISFNDVGGPDIYWVVNGLEIAPSAAPSPPRPIAGTETAVVQSAAFTPAASAGATLPVQLASTSATAAAPTALPSPLPIPLPIPLPEPQRQLAEAMAATNGGDRPSSGRAPIGAAPLTLPAPVAPIPERPSGLPLRFSKPETGSESDLPSGEERQRTADDEASTGRRRWESSVDAWFAELGQLDEEA